MPCFLSTALMCRSRCFVLDDTYRVGVTGTFAQFSVMKVKVSRMNEQKKVIPKNFFMVDEPPQDTI